MPVITHDILIEGIRRDNVLEWLSDPAHHDRILQGAFQSVQSKGDRQWEMRLQAGPQSRIVGYEFLSVDDSHGGRRIRCSTSGRRTGGSLNYSLRTVKPSTNTMVTLHSDYNPGRLLGAMLDMAVMRNALSEAWQAVLGNLQREIQADLQQD
jgi:carbon monoxide dehydrogenase subunit G